MVSRNLNTKLEDHIMDVISEVQKTVPLNVQSYNLSKKNVGLVVVDEVNGFCKPGAGNLAPPGPDKEISNMVQETRRLVERQLGYNLPVMFFQDTHTPGVEEPPYPPHCEVGTGEEELVDELKPFAQSARVIETDGSVSGSDGPVTVLKKDCINGFVGAIDRNNNNAIVEWVNQNKIETIVVVGICTDICVMDFVLTMLSARNHGMMPTLKDVVVYTPGCATYNLPRDVAKNIGLPEFAAHPRDLTDYMGLYFMMSRGAILADKVEG